MSLKADVEAILVRLPCKMLIVYNPCTDLYVCWFSHMYLIISGGTQTHELKAE